MLREDTFIFGRAVIRLGNLNFSLSRFLGFRQIAEKWASLHLDNFTTNNGIVLK